jgi:hypothetical protein
LYIFGFVNVLPRETVEKCENVLRVMAEGNAETGYGAKLQITRIIGIGI